MALEVEAKFRAAGPGPLRALGAAVALGPAELGPIHAARETDRYLDTARGALAAERWACRLRTRGGDVIVSLKGPPGAGTSGAMHRRPEIEAPATPSLDPADWPRSEARDLLDRLRGGDELAERLVLDQDRDERAVRHRGHDVALLTLDTVRVVVAGAPIGTLHMAELELLGESHGRAPMDEMVAALAEVPGLEAEPRTKLERALELLEGR